ncbi:SH3 domain-containing protein [Sulfuriflexus mobilis]|uniref:SH3 domain-containing protein n=1 Tax=Sulfuriflexus mobilis TaxID=1811807 RepID=UPI000F8241B4|nr:SH3 domain-containing protein [Sulfuriflexus mobilis]
MRFVSVLLLLLLFAPLQAEEHSQRASAAMRAGNYAIAYCIWQPLADAGDADAQYNIGWLYHNGYGLAVDDRQALYWWQQAATQKHNDARLALAALYTHGGIGVAAAIDKAIPLYIDSLTSGDEEVRLILRNLLLTDKKSRQLLAGHLKISDWRQLGDIRTVKSKRANIRQGPSLGSAVIHVLDQGDSLLALSRQGRWLQVVVTQTGLGGWVHASLLAPSSP